MPNPGLRLKEPAIAGYAYNPPQTPPFEKEGLVVSLWLTSPKVSHLCIYLGALSKSPFFVTVIVWLPARRSFAALMMTALWCSYEL